ncbi:alcohol dehydrogenase [Trifolium repens]|nr:alcohol dehydrogenase [Trifolium repens]
MSNNTAGQVIKCRAAVAWEAGKPLVIEEVEVAPPQAGEVRLKILFTSLCHTDVYFWEAKGQTPLFPRIFGHEAGGIVESVGEGVTHLKPGDHALPVFTGECGECPHCKSEESNMCNLLRINTDRGVMINDNKSRFSIKGQPVHHFVGTSTFSEYTVVHAGCVAKINPDAPLDKVCILSCGICTGLGATVNVAKPKPGSSVAIFGLGAVGLAAAEGARMSGASRIIGVDLVSSRFELAKKFGVNEFVNPKDHEKPVQQVIAEMTDGGVDRAVECTGSIQAMISAFECVHDGWGVAVLVGVPSKDDAFKTHPMNFLNERTLKGTFYGNYKPRTDLPNVVEQYMRGELELEKFITHSIPFSEINKAFDYMLKGESIRSIFISCFSVETSTMSFSFSLLTSSSLAAPCKQNNNFLVGNTPTFIVLLRVPNTKAAEPGHVPRLTGRQLRQPKLVSLINQIQTMSNNTAGQVIKCRAAVAWEAGKPLVIEEVEVAPPQAGEVRLKILFTSLCHTDVYFWEAKGQNPLFPRIFGHEAGGIVESIGEGVTHLKPGDHALPVFTGECGECPHCKSEESNMCNLLRINTDRGVMINDNQTRFSIKGQPIHHFVGTSTFSEYTVVHAGCVAKINPEAPLDKVCILSCGICTGLGATVNVAKPKPGSSVAIFGLGAVGLAAAEGARISGASRIIGVDLVSSRFELAKKFGVNEFVNPKDHDKPVQQVIAEMTNGGVDRAVECTGSIQAMISAFECVHDGWGVAVLVGVPNKDDAFKTHPMNFLNERTLKGTFYGNYKPRTDLPNVVEKYMKGELELEKFITHTVPFSEINKAFDLMLKGESIRCIIKMEE